MRFLLIPLSVVLVVLLVYTLVGTPFFSVVEIEVDGSSSKTSGKLTDIMAATKGQNLLFLSLDSQTQRILENPWVESAHVQKHFPNRLRVEIKERQPIALVKSQQGHFKYLDEKNRIIEPAPPTEAARFPVIFGNRFFADHNLRNQALEIIRSLPPQGFLSQADVSDIRFDDERGFHLTLVRPRLTVELGQEQLGLRLDRSRKVIQYIERHSIRASRIDADYSKKVLVKAYRDL